MSAYEIILGIVLILASVGIIALVLMQKSREGGLSGAIAGGSGSSDSFFGKNKGRTKEAKLAKMTRLLGIVLFVFVFVAWGLLKYMGNT